MFQLHHGNRDRDDRAPRGEDRARRASYAKKEGPPRKVARPNGLKGHPATNDQVYSLARLRFMQAVEAYMKENNRRFLTMCEYLDIAEATGWRLICPTWASDTPAPRLQIAS